MKKNHLIKTMRLLAVLVVAVLLIILPMRFAFGEEASCEEENADVLAIQENREQKSALLLDGQVDSEDDTAVLGATDCIDAEEVQLTLQAASSGNAMMDDSDATSTAEIIVVGQTVTGSLSSVSAADIYTFTITKESWYYVTFSASNVSGSPLWSVSLFSYDGDSQRLYDVVDYSVVGSCYSELYEKTVPCLAQEIGPGTYALVVSPADKGTMQEREATVGVAYEITVEEGFSDAPNSTPHYVEISWLYESGITSGFPDGTFRPYATVARCDMAAFLYRIAGSPSFTPNNEDILRFSDVSSSTPHAKEIWWLARQGISTGFPDGTFRPYANVARCDMAAFLYRIAGSPFYIPSEADRRRFSDVASTTPHFEEVCWLAARGISTGFYYGFDPYGNVARCDMAAFLYRMHYAGLV